MNDVESEVSPTDATVSHRQTGIDILGSIINTYPSSLNISFYTPKRKQIGTTHVVPIQHNIKKLELGDVGVVRMDIVASAVNKHWTGVVPNKREDPLLIYPGPSGEIVVTYKKMVIPGDKTDDTRSGVSWGVVLLIILIISLIIAGWLYYKKLKRV